MPHGGQKRGAGLAGSTVIVSLPSVGSTNKRPEAIAAMLVSSSELHILSVVLCISKIADTLTVFCKELEV